MTDGVFYALKVRDVMEKRPPTLPPDAPICTVARKLRSAGHVWIINPEQGRSVCGIITEKDLFDLLSPLPEKTYTTTTIRPLRLAHIEVAQASEFMVRPVVSCSPDNTLEEALSIMEERRVRNIAVMEGDRLKGEISLRGVIEQYIATSCVRQDLG